MTKRYWRISYKNIGIYEALKQYLFQNDNTNTWNDLKNSDSFTWLNVPNTYSNNCRSYFTELGYKIFVEKTLPIIQQYLDKDNIICECFNLEDTNLNIVYEDEHQIVME